jgi:hypothetical protein
MKKIAGLFITAFVLVVLAGCGDSLADKASKEGKSAQASQDYEEAEASFEMAMKEGSKDQDAKEVDEIIKAYKESADLFAQGDLENAQKVISSISNYSKLAINEDIDMLKKTIEETIRFNNEFAKEVDSLNTLISQGSFEEGKEIIASLKMNELDEKQEETLVSVEKKLKELEDAIAKK